MPYATVAHLEIASTYARRTGIRRAVGVDINPDAVMVARNRLDFSYTPLDADYKVPEIRTYAGYSIRAGAERGALWLFGVYRAPEYKY